MTIPYKNKSDTKKDQIRDMFDNISGTYDRLNAILSLGIERSWKKNMVKQLATFHPKYVLDMATGTGDIAVLIAERLTSTKVLGLDLAPRMIEYAQKKINEKQLDDRIEVKVGDSEKINYEDNTFDAATVSFGVRNFENLDLGLSEIYRVLTPSGKLLILEFSKPKSFPFNRLYNFYFEKILPNIGRWISKDQAAYSYLYESVQAFPDYEDFVQVLKNVGFKNCKWKSYFLGICCLYIAEK